MFLEQGTMALWRLLYTWKKCFPKASLLQCGGWVKININSVRWGKNILYWPNRAANKTGQKYTVLAWQAQRTNQGGTPFICIREGWPLLTVETGVNGDSKSTNEKGPWACCTGTGDFSSALADLDGPVQNMFFLTVHFINSFVQAAMLGCLSLIMCLWPWHMIFKFPIIFEGMKIAWKTPPPPPTLPHFMISWFFWTT